MSELRELYQEVILDHTKRPRNFREMPDANRQADGHNRLCGDKLKLFVKLEGNVIKDASFQGSGCAISTASASMMTDMLKGKTLTEAETLFHHFHDVVTGPPDEIPDPHDLAMELRVNGEVRQTSHSSRMSVTIPEILSHYSALGYSAGDVVSTGTVSGVAGFSPDAASLYLKPGDVMECEIERIGVLRNPVISWEDAHFEPAPPRVRW